MPEIIVIPPTKTADGETKKIRTAAYARVSSDSDEQQNSFLTQMDYYTQYIKDNPSMQFVDLYADEGVTAIIRNGCGGTRAAYGTAILLRTTAALLDTIQKIQMKKITKSVLIDVSPDSISISDTKFPLEVCNCCGDRNRQ